MKYKYIGTDSYCVKAPCPQTGQRVDLTTGDTVELDWLPGGTKHILVPVVEEKVVEKVVKKVVKETAKPSGFSKIKKKRV